MSSGSFSNPNKAEIRSLDKYLNSAGRLCFGLEQRYRRQFSDVDVMGSRGLYPVGIVVLNSGFISVDIVYGSNCNIGNFRYFKLFPTV